MPAAGTTTGDPAPAGAGDPSPGGAGDTAARDGSAREEAAPDEGVQLPWAERGDALPQVHARLEGLSGEAFQSAAGAALRSAPRETLGALVLRAGPVPPGLTAAAAKRRTAMRAEALDLLAAALTGPEAAVWRGHLEALVREGSGNGPHQRQLTGDLACAAFAAVGKLVLDAERRRTAVDPGGDAAEGEAELHLQRWLALLEAADALAPAMAAALAPGRPARERAAAREALERLHGLRFESPEEYAHFRDQGADGPLVREALREAGRLAQDRLLDLLRLDPSRSAEAWSEPDPALRRRVPELLREGVAAGRLSRGEALALLFAGLADEVDAHAFHARLDALLGLLADVPADDPDARRLRDVLSELALRPDGHLGWSVLHGLTHVPVPRLSAGQTVERVARLFDRQVEQWRPIDADQVVQGLADVSRLAERVGPDPQFARLWPALSFLLEDYSHPGSLAVRRAAARTAGRVAGSEQLDELLAVLDGTQEDQLVYELVSALAHLAQAGAEDPGAQARIAAALVPRLEHPSLDVRRLTLDVLASEALGEVVAGGADLPAQLLARMRVEDSPGLLIDQLRLLSRFERPGLVPELLDTPALERLSADPRGLDELTAALRRLAGSDPRRVLQAARGLAALEQEQSFVARRERALELVLALSDASVRELEPRAHGEVLGWLRELRAARGGAVGDEERWVRWCLRALDLHLPLARAGREGPSCSLVHLEALLRTDLLLLRRRDPALAERLGIPPRGIESGAVSSLYSQALELCQQEEAPSAVVAELRRDWARMLAVIGADGEALELYAEVLAASPRPDTVLDVSDLRRIVRLAQTGRDAERAGLALRAARAVLESPTWPLEPAGVRHQDLVAYLRGALALEDREARERARALVADLPTALPGPGTDGAPDGWAWLADHADWHAELLALREQLAAAPARREAGEAERAPVPTDGGGAPVVPPGGPRPRR